MGESDPVVHKARTVERRQEEDPIVVAYRQHLKDVMSAYRDTQIKEEIVSKCSAKERITEMRLAALETGTPIDPLDVIQEALDELRKNSSERRSYYIPSTNPYFTGDYHYYDAVGPGVDAAIALLKFALERSGREIKPADAA